MSGLNHKPFDPPAPPAVQFPKDRRGAQRIHREAQSPGLRYRVRLTGRLGGKLYLELHPGELSSGLGAFALQARLAGKRLQPRRVGAQHGSSASPDSAWGWIYLEGRAQPVEVGPTRLLARIGSDQQVTPHRPDLTAWAMAARDAGWAEA